ncbi:hypothetical protein GQ53DRAFT_163241 [Thozetella sp. PMI_491]|nr:hypothetical protein GQ53DRAFT_163241 [Thozetella sp. PMI_491]
MHLRPLRGDSSSPMSPEYSHVALLDFDQPVTNGRSLCYPTKLGARLHKVNDWGRGGISGGSPARPVGMHFRARQRASRMLSPGPPPYQHTSSHWVGNGACFGFPFQCVSSVMPISPIDSSTGDSLRKSSSNMHLGVGFFAGGVRTPVVLYLLRGYSSNNRNLAWACLPCLTGKTEPVSRKLLCSPIEALPGRMVAVVLLTSCPILQHELPPPAERTTSTC